MPSTFCFRRSRRFGAVGVLLGSLLAVACGGASDDAADGAVADAAAVPTADTATLSAKTVAIGGFTYDSDYYGDELPFWQTVQGKPHLVVPYSLTNNDGKYAAGMTTSEQWFTLCRDAFDVLYAEGATAPKMMSVGLHQRIIGHPGRMAGLWRLLDYIQQKQGVWVTRRLDIANHWTKTHPYKGKGLNE